MFEKLSAWYSKHFYSYAEAKAWLSVKWNFIVVGLAGIWAVLPDETKTAVVAGVLGIISRVVPTFSLPTSLVVGVVAIVTLYFRLKKQVPKDDAGSQ